MASTLYRDTGFTLMHLVEDIKEGRLALPDIQRPFVWPTAKARDLFDSMYRGYPVGTLMFWQTDADPGSTRQIGTGAVERVPQLLVVDGQQRLTSLYAVLTGEPVLTKSYESKRIRIGFRPEDETFVVTDAAIENDPEFIPDITKLWEQGYKGVIRRFMDRLEELSGGSLSDSDRERLEERIDKVRSLREFRFQVIELDADEEQVAEIFVRINSEGVQLNQSDFILTLMSVHWEKGRRELEAFCRAAVEAGPSDLSPRNPYLEKPSPDQLLRVGVALAFRRARLQHVYSILRGKDLDTGKVSAELRERQFEKLEQAQQLVLDLDNWHEFLECLRFAGFRNRKMITSDATIVYSYALWLIGKHDFNLDTKTLRRVIGRWFFMTHTTGRYTNSPESQFEFDLGRIADLKPGDGDAYVAELDRVVRANFTNDYWTISLPNRLDTSSSRSPVWFAYLAALNLLDAELLFGGGKVKDSIDAAMTRSRSIERSNLFPKRYLAGHGVTSARQINAIGNMALIDWSSDPASSEADPAQYWPILSARLGGERLKDHMRWHALPVGWEQLDYPEFLEKRRSLIAAVVREAFERLWDGQPANHSLSIEELIRSPESQNLEFKTTVCRNMRTGEVDRARSHVVVKTVCGFLNAEGGSLVIGVGENDAGNEVIGVEGDMATLGKSKANQDGYEMYLRQVLDANLSVPTVSTVKIRFHQVQGRTLCELAVAQSGRPVFAKPPKHQGSSKATDFWVRVGNATKQLHGDDMVRYQEDHWGQ